MGCRKVPLVTGYYYHVFNKSIAGYEIFRFSEEYDRFLETLRFYKTALAGACYSDALKNNNVRDPAIHGKARVKLIAYCVMPTHFHFLISQMTEGGLKDFMRFMQGSYSVYFNAKTKRRGPLWTGRFGARLITKDEDLLSMTRYIHLNPVSAGLVAHPENWKFSSYHDYAGECAGEVFCDAREKAGLSPEQYKKFVCDHEGYQRSLQVIKAHLMD